MMISFSFFATIHLEHEGVLVGQAVVAVGGMVGRLDGVGGREGRDQAGHLFPHAAVQFCNTGKTADQNDKKEQINES
jgi:hypothetical protein